MKTINSLQHPQVKHMVKLQVNARYRHTCGSVVVEGIKMARELQQAGLVKSLWLTSDCLAAGDWKNDNLCIVNDEIIAKIAGSRAPEGVIAEVAMPEPSNLRSLRRILVLDKVSDPGNLGALMRSALAFGWEGIFLIEGSCDPFNDKALRAAKGATFRLPWRVGSWEELRADFSEVQFRFIAADMDGACIDTFEPGEKALLLVVGNEGQGLSPEALECCEKVTIPMAGAMESLNVSVAGSIIMYILRGRK